MSSLFGSTFSLDLRDGRRAFVTYGAAAGLGLLVLLIGWLITTGQLLLAILLCVAWPVVLVVTWAGPAAVAGVILLLTLDGVPGVSLEHLNVHGTFEFIDICALAFIAFATIRYFYGSRNSPDRYTRLLVVWSALFLVVWMLAFAKALDRGVPALKAALFGRDFLYFALLVPLASALVKNERELTRFVTVVGALTTLWAVGEIATSLGALQPSIINAKQVHELGPLTRVYASMNDAVALGFCCALAYALLHKGKRATWAAMIAITCGVAVVLQLTRALYVGLVVGMILAFIIWAAGHYQLRSRFRRRTLWTIATLIVIGVVAAVVVPQLFSGSAIKAITNRVTEGVSDVSSSSSRVGHNTFAYRQDVSSIMLEILGSHWILGLGFLHPSAVYFPQLPHGSIRNSDVGLFNTLMTMGVVGTILIYVPVIMALVCVAPNRGPDHRWDWLRLGSMIWLISVLAGSLTLVTLFSPNGLILTAVLLGVIFGDAQRRSGRAVENASTPSARGT